MDNRELTPFEKEKYETGQIILNYLLPSEANVVASFWKYPEVMYDFRDVDLSSFHTNTWRVYWQIAHDIFIKEKKESLDELTVSFYLEKHLKLKDKYDEYGGYDTIIKAGSYIKKENIVGYVLDLQKWNAVFEMNKRGFPVKEQLSDFADMSLDEIYATLQAQINNTFLKHSDSLNKSYDVSDNIDDLIESLEAGSEVGLPYGGMPLLNQFTGGCMLGNITLVGGVTNAGKSTFVRDVHIPTLIMNNEKCVIMINEEDLSRIQRELIVWYVNNKLHFDLQKYVLKEGVWNDETKSKIMEAVEWLKSMKSQNLLTVIPFKTYTTSNAIKVINKYSALGVKYFILDTFKADSTSAANENVRIQMIMNMTALYDTIKPANKNVHLLCTMQLNKAAVRQTYYALDNVGESKGIVDVASTAIMMRKVFDNEKLGGTKELKVYQDEIDAQGIVHQKIVPLDPKKTYQVFFTVKSREGSTERQTVCEVDFSRNIYKEVGYCNVPYEMN